MKCVRGESRDEGESVTCDDWGTHKVTWGTSMNFCRWTPDAAVGEGECQRIGGTSPCDV